MSGTEIKRRGGPQGEHATFVGAAREITIDETLNQARVHDSVTAGGALQAREDLHALETPIGNRNRIINGDFRVQQRPDLYIAPGAGGQGYGPDRFGAVSVSTAGLTLSNAVPGLALPSPKISAVIDPSDAASGVYYINPIFTALEGNDVFDLSETGMVCSFDFAAASDGAYSFSLFSNSGFVFVGRFSYPGGGASRVEVKVPPLPTGSEIIRTNGAGIFIFIGSVATYDALLAEPGEQWQASEIPLFASDCLPWVESGGYWIEVARLKLEPGSVATPFCQEDYSASLKKCQRYYETGEILWSGNTVSAENYTARASFKVKKRDAPTIVLTDSSPTTNFNSVEGSVSLENQDGFCETREANGTGSGGVFVSQWTASAEIG